MCHHLLAILLSVCSAMRQGLTPLYLQYKQTEIANFIKVEGRANVRIGITDTIVHVERRKTTLTTIVGSATTVADAKTGTRNHSLVKNRVQRYKKKSV